ncbi:MAG: sigma factor [Chloroflexota bacterium]
MTDASSQAASGRGDDIHRALDAVWRMESPRLIAALTRIVRDVGLAEDLAQDALEAAIRQWPAAGIPDRPAAWLMATARHRAIDALRRRTTLQRKADAPDGGHAQGLRGDVAVEQALGDVEDPLLRHPICAKASLKLAIRGLYPPGPLGRDDCSRSGRPGTGSSPRTGRRSSW